MAGVRASPSGRYVLVLLKAAPSEIWTVRIPFSVCDTPVDFFVVRGSSVEREGSGRKTRYLDGARSRSAPEALLDMMEMGWTPHSSA